MTKKLRKFEDRIRVEVKRERRERKRAQAVREASPDCAWRIEFPHLASVFDRVGGKTAKQNDLTRAVKGAERYRTDPYTGERVLIDADSPRRDDLLHPDFLVSRPFDETWDESLTGYRRNIGARSMHDEQTQGKVKDPRTGWTARGEKKTFEFAELRKFAPSPFDAEPDT